MSNNKIEKDVVVKRVNGIEAELQELRKLGTASLDEFKSGVGFKLAQYHLHRALEGVFNIATHILSRLPGAQATTYKEIALQLGEKGIIDALFAADRLVKMAKYRNRLVHFYAEVTADELYDIIQNHLGDFGIFLAAVSSVIEKPEKFSLTIE
jgi:uncharacterized protein YutE (UPF0331/DUF86 family)